jgi:hypothetical protein
MSCLLISRFMRRMSVATAARAASAAFFSTIRIDLLVQDVISLARERSREFAQFRCWPAVE